MRQVDRSSASALAFALAGVLLASLLWSRPVQAADVNTSQKTGDDSECSIAKNPANGNQLFKFCNSSGPGLFAARSTDGGLTWSYPDPSDKTIADGDAGQGPAGCCDPSLAWDSFGNLFVTYLDASSPDHGVVALLSTNGGATFSTLATFTGSLDQQTVVVANTSAPGAPVAVWMVWNQSGSMVARGAAVTGLGAVGSFGPLQSIPGTSSCSFGDIAIAPSGAVVQACQNPTFYPHPGPSTIYVNTDADGLGPGGFGPAVVATTSNVGTFDFIPAQNARTIDPEAGLAFDSNPSSPRFGRLYLVYTEETALESNDTDIRLRWSDNNGATWSSSIRVNDDPASPIRSQFLPRIVVDPTSGGILVCWHDCRESPSNTAMRVYCASATPAGATPTFSANVAVGDGLSVSHGDLLSVEFGDYAGLAYQQGLAHPVWADTSNSTGNNPNGTGNFDAYTDRVTACIPAGAPALLAPGDGATGIALAATLDWADVVGATSYEVELATDAGFNNIVRSHPPTASTWVVSPPLANDTTYHWRARATTCGPGAWSASRSFITVETGYVDCGTGCVNLAPNKPVTYSGLWNATTNPQTKLVDGNTGTTSACQGSTGYCAIASDANQGQAAGNFFQIDLGAVKSIQSVRVFGRRDTAFTQGQNLLLKLSQNGTTWTTYPMADTTMQAGFLVPTGRLARYVKVETINVVYLSLYEVIVTGLCDGGPELCDGDDDNCDGLVDASCGTSTATCSGHSASIDFQATGGNSQFCLSEGLCSNTRCNNWCQATDVINACNGDTTSCPGGTRAKYTSGTLLLNCYKSNPSLCRCSCQANGSTYVTEIPVPCTTCGNGICEPDNGEWCDTCPGDCPQTVVSLPNGQCEICDRTGEMHCGPGTFQWCCY